MKRSYITVEVSQRDKAGFVKAAQREHLKLSEWVKKHLNVAKRNAGVKD